VEQPFKLWTERFVQENNCGKVVGGKHTATARRMMSRPGLDGTQGFLAGVAGIWLLYFHRPSSGLRTIASFCSQIQTLHAGRDWSWTFRIRRFPACHSSIVWGTECHSDRFALHSLRARPIPQCPWQVPQSGKWICDRCETGVRNCPLPSEVGLFLSAPICHWSVRWKLGGHD